jgi:alpha-beta hydrolase superfamily lysophospholipase
VSIDVTIPVPGVRDDRGGPLQLAGWFLPADPAADEFQNGAVVVLTHGFNSAKGKVWTDPSIGYRGSLFDQAASSLVDAGFHVLMFDFRNHGGSGDAGTVSLGLRESVDVMAAVRFAAVELPKTDVPIDPDRIGVRAPSMGAVATILAAAKLDRSGRIKAIWCDSPFATANHAISDFLTYAGVPRLLLPPVKFWLQQLAGVRLDDLRPIDHVAAARCPVVITHSADDTMIDVDHFYRYRDVAAEHDRIETRLYQGVQHHRLWTIPRYLPQQADFFRRTLAAVDIGTKTTESEAETVTAGDVVSPTPERRPTP